MKPVQFIESVCKSIISTQVTLSIDLQTTVEVDFYFSSGFSEVSRKASRFNNPRWNSTISV